MTTYCVSLIVEVEAENEHEAIKEVLDGNGHVMAVLQPRVAE